VADVEAFESPIAGSSTSPARITPAIEPSVFHPYTAPMARSPALSPSRMRVMSGSVMPAQKVAGSMIARHRA
jgi:hypothetical protein